MDRRVRMLLLGALACAVLFALILVAAYGFPATRKFDAKALQSFLGFQRPSVNRLTDGLHSIGNPLEVVVIGGGLALIALLRGRPRTAVAVVALIGLTSISSQILKAVLAYPRFTGKEGFTDIPSAAFPSGHSTAAMSLAIAAVMVVPPGLRPLAAVVGTGVALAVGVAMIALGAHFPSDVAGGYLLATFWGLVLAAALREAELRWPSRTKPTPAPAAAVARGTEVLAGAGLAALALAGVLGAATLGFLVLVKVDLSALVSEHTAAVLVAGLLLLLLLTLLSGLVIGLRRRGSD